MSYSTIIAGLLISFLMLEISGIYPGGIIVPCYLSYYIASEPLRVLSTFMAAGLTLVCYRAVSGHLLIFGRRKYVFMLSVAGSSCGLYPMNDMAMMSPRFASNVNLPS